MSSRRTCCCGWQYHTPEPVPPLSAPQRSHLRSAGHLSCYWDAAVTSCASDAPRSGTLGRSGGATAHMRRVRWFHCLVITHSFAQRPTAETAAAANEDTYFFAHGLLERICAHNPQKHSLLLSGVLLSSCRHPFSR